MRKSGIITKKDISKENEAYHDIITRARNFMGVRGREQGTFAAFSRNLGGG